MQHEMTRLALKVLYTTRGVWCLVMCRANTTEFRGDIDRIIGQLEGYIPLDCDCDWRVQQDVGFRLQCVLPKTRLEVRHRLARLPLCQGA